MVLLFSSFGLLRRNAGYDHRSWWAAEHICEEILLGLDFLPILNRTLMPRFRC